MQIEPAALPQRMSIGASFVRAPRRDDTGHIFAAGSITAAVYLTVLLFCSTEKSPPSPIARQLFICLVVATLAWLYVRAYQLVNRALLLPDRLVLLQVSDKINGPRPLELTECH